MLKVIRSSVFETNSSSVHAICISKDKPLEKHFPDKVDFQQNYFGRSFQVLTTINEKATYLYQAICDLSENQKEKTEYQNYLYETLGELGIECSFIENHDDWCSIDHSYELKDFLKLVLSNKNRLLRYLFSDTTIVLGSDENDYFFDYMNEHSFENHEIFE